MAIQLTGIVALGAYRHVAEGLTSIFQGHSWRLAAVLDLQDPQYRYNAHNLAVTLRNLVPRPQCLIIGLAIDNDVAKEAERVFRDYVQSCNIRNAHVWQVSGRPIAVPMPEL